jgi:N utilization substance protein B
VSAADTRGDAARPRGMPGRRRARELAFRAAYQADVMAESVLATWETLREEERLTDDQRALAEDVVRLLAGRGAEVDARLQGGASHWPLDRLAATDRAVLRVALAEMLARPGTPARVVIDEAIELAKRYGSEESGRFVNGVLDGLARELRAGEFG